MTGSATVAVRSSAGGRAGASTSLFAGLVSLHDAISLEAIDIDPASSIDAELDTGRIVLVSRRTSLVVGWHHNAWVVGPDAAIICASIT